MLIFTFMFQHNITHFIRLLNWTTFFFSNMVVILLDIFLLDVFTDTLNLRISTSRTSIQRSDHRVCNRALVQVIAFQLHWLFSELNSRLTASAFMFLILVLINKCFHCFTYNSDIFMEGSIFSFLFSTSHSRRDTPRMNSVTEWWVQSSVCPFDSLCWWLAYELACHYSNNQEWLQNQSSHPSTNWHYSYKKTCPEEDKLAQSKKGFLLPAHLITSP